MAFKVGLVLGVSLVVLVIQTKGQQDDTQTPGAKGADVVGKVEELLQGTCVFPDDKLFGRRLAFVESTDGLHGDTYRPGYHGGIYQVDEAMFQQTQTSTGLQQYTDAVQQAFGITWSQVTWKDLRKPLYSGIGARLYYLDQAGSTDVPRDIPEQAQFWTQFYRPSGDPQYYINAANQLEKGCTGNGVDMVFVIDGSGSIGSSNFHNIRLFIKGVVEAFDIGPDHTQVGLIKYSTAVTNEFFLNTYSTKEEVVEAVEHLRYEGGGTNTHEALEALVNKQFTAGNGARDVSEGLPRVAIVLTDGISNDPARTVLAAMRAHEADITMFAIGIGSSLDMNELEAIASLPTCLHLFLLEDFTEVEALKYAIEKRTCEAPVIIGPGNNGTDIGGSIPPGGDQNCKLRVPQEGATIKIRANTGRATYYTALDTYPSEAYYERKVEAVGDKLGVMFVPQPPTPDAETLIFCNIKGDEDEESDLEIGVSPGPDKDLCRSDPCQHGGTCVDEGDTYRCDCLPDFTGHDCGSVVDPCVSNPCRMGTCTSDGDGGYSCECTPGFTGENCDIEIDNCNPDPCQFGECCNRKEGYKCFCDPGYTGPNCDTELDKCKPNPCHHGQCQSTPEGYVCECDAGYTGEHCDQEIDKCKPNPCDHGQCQSTPEGYVCECDAGYTGEHCEQEIDKCKPNPCDHGQCQSTPEGYVCECDVGYTGEHCEQNKCKPNPCDHGQCQPTPEGYVCECDAGYTGEHCGQEIDKCKPNPCDHGQCQSTPEGYVCECDVGYTGEHCEQNKCKPNPCDHGQCQPTPEGYVCECDAGYTGEHCGQEIDPCKPNPCVHGYCQSKPPAFSCECDAGWTGDQCDEEESGGGYNCGDSNPCSPLVESGRFYYPHQVASKFVQCSEWGQCYEMDCPPGLVWNDVAYTCTP